MFHKLKTNCVDDFSLVCLCNLNLFTPPNEPNLFDFITGNANLCAVATVAMGVGANDDRGELSSVGGC
jgi:hypothetical protein